MTLTHIHLLRHLTSSVVPTTRFTAKAFLLKVGPITRRVIHRDLHPSFHPPRHNQNPFNTTPHKLAKLGVGSTRVVDKSCVVPHPFLLNLILIVAVSTRHDIHAFDSSRHEPYKFANSCPSVEATASEKAVVLAAGAFSNLYWSWRRVNRGE